MQKTPKSLRLHIGIFGRTNTGKSSFLNMIVGQDIAITSPVPGTTTDVVEKPMELLPLGPVVFLDTAGLDDTSELGQLRIAKTRKALDRCDIVLILAESQNWTDYEDALVAEIKTRKLPFIIAVNKADISAPDENYLKKIKQHTEDFFLCASTDKANREQNINNLKKLLIKLCPDDFLTPPPLLGDLLPQGGTAVLIVPIDLQAPKGRLILPQVQAIRDALDNDCTCVVVKENGYKSALENLKIKPDLVVCDSQVVLKMVEETPADIKCTTFSILFARLKGDLEELACGSASIAKLKPGDKVLIAEACTHHPTIDDIGRIKIPRWLKQYFGADVVTDICIGRDYPENLKDYKLIIHCGACMHTRREMLVRMQKAREAGVPITNYGLAISFLRGVIKRTLEPFPSVLNAFLDCAK